LPLLYSIGKVTVGPALMLGWRPHVEGLENIPKTGGLIFAGNHLSVADELFLGASVPRHIAFWAKSDYFTGTGFNGWLSRTVLNGLGAIAVERGGGRAALTAFDGAIPVLQGGDCVAVYPEGTRSPDGRLYRGKTGIARMALEAGVPVIPVAMVNTDVVQPTGKVIPKIGRVGIRVGKPLDFSRYQGMEGDRFVLRSITDEIMYELMLLSGQEYVDTYATKAKADIEDARLAAREALVSDAPSQRRAS